MPPKIGMTVGACLLLVRDIIQERDFNTQKHCLGDIMRVLRESTPPSLPPSSPDPYWESYDFILRVLGKSEEISPSIFIEPFLETLHRWVFKSGIKPGELLCNINIDGPIERIAFPSSAPPIRQLMLPGFEDLALERQTRVVDCPSCGKVLKYEPAGKDFITCFCGNVVPVSNNQ